MRNILSWNVPALVLTMLLLAAPAAALAEDAAAPPAAPGTIAPMPDAALPGAYCLAGAAAAMAAAFAAGPTESIMLLSGAMHVPSNTAVLFIPLLSILGGGACALGAAAQPAVSWAIEQSDNIATRLAAAGQAVFGARRAEEAEPLPAVRPLTEGEMQSVGCVAGALAGFAAAMATSPIEVAMLSSGANTVVGSTAVLKLGLLGTIVASGCVIGNYAILPIQAFFGNFTAIGDSIGNGLAQVGGAASDGAARALALVTGGAPAVKVADSEPAR